ncbi:OprD family porin [Pseudomonas sp. S37]|uniref:OprD family porin n=1 Tax=Pseudomonas sp. S37 TaxID=2767449 RepID=UPI0019130FD1|nr:OprD family porin [Pseudomonas sp. S37]MBK4992435.1 OprD family porin [Pseudomonas sp. S37]
MNNLLRSLIPGALVLPLSCVAYADFLADSKANLKLRNFYFSNDYRDRPGPAGQSRIEEWAQGAVLDFQSGFTEGPVGVGVDAMALLGVTLDSGDGRHRGSSMIPNKGDGAADQWGRLGVTPKLRWSKTELRYGTLLPNLPVITYNDSRTLPQTFEGALLTSHELEKLTFTAGRITKATGRGSTDRTGLAVSGGTRQSDAMVLAGVDYQIGEKGLAQYYFANLEDYYDQHFLGLQNTWQLAPGQSLKADLRYFRTTADDANKSAEGRVSGYRVGGFTESADGKIDNHLWTAALTYQVGGNAVMMGYQQVSNGSNFVQQSQGTLPDKGAGASSLYIYTDRMMAAFNRAGERSVFGQYSYDFAAMGVPGLKAFVMYVKGEGINTATGPELSEWERDMGIDYVVQSGTFKGLGFGWRHGLMHSDIDPNQVQNRVFLNYTLALF